MSRYDSQKKRRMSLQDRLLEGSISVQSGCREWAGGTNENGYGRMSYNGKVYRAHRLAAHAWLNLDLKDPSVKVCHHCDNPPCINPEHLYLGSQATNVKDMHSRGRGYPGPGPSTHCKKGHELTPTNRVAGNGRCLACARDYQRARKGIPEESYRVKEQS